MLEDFEDFDSSRLEELAESLLAGVTSEFEDDASKSSHRTTKTEGKSKSMLGPMVGSKTENMESGQNTNGSISMRTTNRPTVDSIKKEILDGLPTTDDDLYVSAAPIAPTNQMQFMQSMPSMHFDHTQFNHSEQMFDIDYNSNTNNTATINLSNIDKSMIFRQSSGNKTADINNNNNNDTLYETTFDSEGNTITVILPDEDISNFEEVIEEIGEEEDEFMSHVSALSPIPSAGYKSPDSLNGSEDAAIVSDHDSAYDSAINSPPGKLSSDWSTTSSVNYIDDDYQCGDYWSQDSFSVLFPSLA